MKDNNVKNVLSIDMDYIMAQCINMYNDCAGREELKNGNKLTYSLPNEVVNYVEINHLY